MASPSKAGAALSALREALAGDVFAPGEPGYDEARTVLYDVFRFNHNIRPAGKALSTA